MTFGVVITLTNPLFSGYLASFAALKAWSKLADEIMIIDGGSKDGSLEKIHEILVGHHNWHIISNEKTNWGAEDNWHALQLLYNINLGIAKIKTDWAYAFSSDYVPYNWDKTLLFHELSCCSNEYWVRTFVGKPMHGQIVHKYNNRNIIFNLKKIKSENLLIHYGIEFNEGPSDFPIVSKEISYILDPENGISKEVYKGSAVKSNICINLECISYGHFFYNIDQLEKKLIRWNRVFSKYYGVNPSSIFELKILQHFDALNWGNFYSKKELLSWDHPTEIAELINQYYEENTIGGVRPLKVSIAHWLIIRWFIYKRKCIQMISSFIGNDKGEKTKMKWSSINYKSGVSKDQIECY